MRLLGVSLFVIGIVFTLLSPVPFLVTALAQGQSPISVFILFGLAGLVGLGLTSVGLVLGDPPLS